MKENELKCPKCGSIVLTIQGTAYVLHKEVTYQKDEWYIHNLRVCYTCGSTVII